MMLLWLLLVPFIGGLLCWQFERFGTELVRWVALGTMLLVLAIAADLWLTGDYSLTLLHATGDQGGRWTEQFSVPWIPRLGVRFSLGLDGLSLLLVALTALLGLTAVACSWREITRHIGFFHLNLMWTLGGVIGVFLATDLFLFFFFWEMMLVPMFFLIALWGHNIPGGRGRIYAATKFFIFTQGHAPAGPGMHWWIHIAECPYDTLESVRSDACTIRAETTKPRLCEIGIGQRNRHAVKRQIPGRVPGILPFVRHGDDVFIKEMAPLGIAPPPAIRRRRRHPGVARQPILDHEVIKLLAPKHAGERLALDPCRFGFVVVRLSRIELIRLLDAAIENPVPLLARRSGLLSLLSRNRSTFSSPGPSSTRYTAHIFVP